MICVWYDMGMGMAVSIDWGSFKKAFGAPLGLIFFTVTMRVYGKFQKSGHSHHRVDGSLLFRRPLRLLIKAPLRTIRAYWWAIGIDWGLLGCLR